MSWDLLLLNLPPGIETIDQVPEDCDVNLGPLQAVLTGLNQVFGDAIYLRDQTWGMLEGEHFSIEFNIGSKDPCESIMLHVRGDDSAIEPIKALCFQTGWSAFDTSSGELLNFHGDPAVGLRTWREWKDPVLPSADQGAPSNSNAAGDANPRPRES
jgi:hypothetical protein